MRSSKKERPLADPSMDMTPMIDVVFLLLIFFLCMEFKSLEGKLGANLPREGRWNTAARPKETLDLRIVCTDWGREVLDEPNDPKGRFELLGHKTQVYIGARLVQDRTELELELRRAALVKVIGEAGPPHRPQSHDQDRAGRHLRRCHKPDRPGHRGRVCPDQLRRGAGPAPALIAALDPGGSRPRGSRPP